MDIFKELIESNEMLIMFAFAIILLAILIKWLFDEIEK